MRLTAPFPVSDRPVEEKSILRWVNDEALRVMREVRTFANFISYERQEADTLGGGAYIRIWTSDAMPTNGVWRVSHESVGRSSSGTVQWAVFQSYIVAGSASATVTQLVANTNQISSESTAAIDCRLVVDTTNRKVYLEARDDATSPMHWVSVIRTQEALP